jgi:hypothetical protein
MTASAGSVRMTGGGYDWHGGGGEAALGRCSGRRYGIPPGRGHWVYRASVGLGQSKSDQRNRTARDRVAYLCRPLSWKSYIDRGRFLADLRGPGHRTICRRCGNSSTVRRLTSILNSP